MRRESVTSRITVASFLLVNPDICPVFLLGGLHAVLTRFFNKRTFRLQTQGGEGNISR